MAVSPEIRQCMIIVSSLLASVSIGGGMSYPTLLIDQLQNNETSTITQLDIHTKTWIGSIYGIAGALSIIMPITAQIIGRKWGYVTACLCSMLGWVLAYRSKSVTDLLVSESFQGLGTNSMLLICFMAMSEMLSPNYRHIYMNAFGITQGIGIASCGILGRYLHYKTVSLIMLVPIAIATSLALLWLESPSWHAYRGEFDRCQKTFIKLRGLDELSKKELQELIAAQKENLKRVKQGSIVRLFKIILRRDFYMPTLHIFVLFFMTYWGGVDLIFVYFIEIVKKSTNNNDEATFYASIIMYLIIVGALCITNVLVRKMKCKTLLKYSGIAIVICLLVSSLISGLQTVGVLSEDSLLLMYCLVAYTGCAKLGFHGLAYIIAGDLMPVKHRSVGGSLYIIMNCILYASSLKLAPYLSLYLGLWCLFLIFAVNVSKCLWFLLKYMPETKGKTLQDIEDFYMFGKFIKRDLVDDSNQLFNPT